MKRGLIGFDAGTELLKHASPEEAIIFALEEEDVIGYESKIIQFLQVKFAFCKIRPTFIKSYK